ncbi:MAG: pilus assembly protein TadG-related protein [Pseudomonadota bacterium]
MLPLAAIGIFAMCLGALATMNLGQAVYQKIKMQNTTDSAAYSLAAMEARTFNYIAFLNRTQIAHYNAAMAEYAIIVATVVSALFFSGFQFLPEFIDALQLYYDSFYVWISAPVP